jgi:trigger factor
MKTSVKMLNDVEVQVEVEIPSQDVDKEVQRQLGMVRRQARVKGFRPGKAPKHVVKRMYGAHIASEAARSLIGSTMGDALKEAGKSPVGEPSIEPTLAQEGQAMTYTIRVQVRPEFEVTDWEGIEVSVPSAKVEGSAIDEELTRRQQSNAERVPVEGRGADTGDIIATNLLGSVEGEADERLTTPGLDVKIGSGTLIPGFEDQLLGVKIGDSRTVEVTFPEEYHAPDLAGKAATFEAEITGVFTEELPDLDDDFAKDVGFDDLAALKGSIEENLQTATDKQRQQALEEKLITALLERTQFTAPPSMVQMQMDSQIQRIMTMYRYQGMGAQEAMRMVEENTQDIMNGAQRAVRRYLLMDTLSKQLEVKIDDDELNAAILERVQEAGAMGGQLYQNDDQKEGLRLELQEKAALDLVIERAKISEDEPEASAEETATKAVAKKAKSGTKTAKKKTSKKKAEEPKSTEK